MKAAGGRRVNDRNGRATLRFILEQVQQVLVSYVSLEVDCF